MTSTTKIILNKDQYMHNELERKARTILRQTDRTGLIYLLCQIVGLANAQPLRKMSSTYLENKIIKVLGAEGIREFVEDHDEAVHQSEKPTPPKPKRVYKLDEEFQVLRDIVAMGIAQGAIRLTFTEQKRDNDHRKGEEARRQLPGGLQGLGRGTALLRP